MFKTKCKSKQNRLKQSLHLSENTTLRLVLNIPAFISYLETLVKMYNVTGASFYFFHSIFDAFSNGDSSFVCFLKFENVVMNLKKKHTF